MARRVNRRGAATRQALIEAAIELWSAAGWQVGRISTVAERVGLTDAGLLRHFGTKADFLIEVLTELDHRQLTRFEAGTTEGLDAIRRLPELARAPEERPGLWKLHLTFQAENLEPGDPAYDYYQRRQHFIHDRFADAIRHGQASDEIRSDADPDLVAAQVLAFLLGMGFHNEHGPKGIDAAAVCEDFANRLVQDLTKA